MDQILFLDYFIQLIFNKFYNQSFLCTEVKTQSYYSPVICAREIPFPCCLCVFKFSGTSIKIEFIINNILSQSRLDRSDFRISKENLDRGLQIFWIVNLTQILGKH